MMSALDKIRSCPVCSEKYFLYGSCNDFESNISCSTCKWQAFIIRAQLPFYQNYEINKIYHFVNGAEYNEQQFERFLKMKAFA